MPTLERGSGDSDSAGGEVNPYGGDAEGLSSEGFQSSQWVAENGSSTLVDGQDQLDQRADHSQSHRGEHWHGSGDSWAISTWEDLTQDDAGVSKVQWENEGKVLQPGEYLVFKLVESELVAQAIGPQKGSSLTDHHSLVLEAVAVLGLLSAVAAVLVTNVGTDDHVALSTVVQLKSVETDVLFIHALRVTSGSASHDWANAAIGLTVPNDEVGGPDHLNGLVEGEIAYIGGGQTGVLSTNLVATASWDGDLARVEDVDHDLPAGISNLMATFGLR